MKINLLKKRVHFIFVVFTVIFIFLYFRYGDYLKSETFGLFQKGMESGISEDKIILVSDTFYIQDYNNLCDKVNKIENAVVLLLPQIFNIKTGDYLENINIKEIELMKKEYRTFTLKLAESKNIIPVTFLWKYKNPEKSVDLGAHSYFKPSKVKMRLKDFNYVQVKSRRMWLTSGSVGFFRDYDYYPYKIPVLFRYGKYVMSNAAVEGIRKYYKFSKNRITLDKRNLKMGSIINFPLLSTGEMILPRVNSKPKIYSLKQFISMPDSKINDKIVIVKSSNISENTMLSLGAAVSSILSSRVITYNKIVNYIFAFILVLGLAGLYMRFGLKIGFVMFFTVQAVLAGAAFMLLRNNIYTDIVMFTFVNIGMFISIYYYSISAKAIDFRKRVRSVERFMHSQVAENFVRENRDIQTKNMWMDAIVIYVMFDKETAEDPEGFKKAFEKVNELVYNKFHEYYIKTVGNNEIVFILLNDRKNLKKVMQMLFNIRGKTGEFNFNILINSSQVYVYEYNGELIFIDKNYSLKADIENIERKKHIIVYEQDVQKYIDLIKFQKIAGSGNNHIFNIVGAREEG